MESKQLAAIWYEMQETKRSLAIIIVSSSAEMSSSIFTVWWQVICTPAELTLRESNCYML
jgi:hypothetical protein